MELNQLNPLPAFLERLGLDEDPMAMFFTDKKPSQGYSPRPMELPTRENVQKKINKSKKVWNEDKN